MPDPLDPEFWIREASRFSGELSELFMLALLAGAGSGIDLLPPNLRTLIGWDVINQAALDFLRTYQFEWIKDITETTRRQTVQAIEQWIESGDPISALESRLIPIFGDSRARSIAVTEVTRIFASGNMMAWQSTGFVGAKKWQTAVDERVCPFCRPLHNKIVQLEGQFALLPQDMTPELLQRRFRGGYEFAWMGPPAHPNCRCWLLPVVSLEGLREQIRQGFGWFGDLDVVEYLEANKVAYVA